MQDEIITTAKADAKFLKRELEMQKAIREEKEIIEIPIIEQSSSNEYLFEIKKRQ